MDHQLLITESCGPAAPVSSPFLSHLEEKLAQLQDNKEELLSRIAACTADGLDWCGLLAPFGVDVVLSDIEVVPGLRSLLAAVQGQVSSAESEAARVNTEEITGT
mgnify:CR=1 FL=1